MGLFGRTKSTRFLTSSDSGMICIWNLKTFQGIVDYPTWEASLLEDEEILGHIRTGALVPLTRGDSASEIEVRIFPGTEMNSRENDYTLVRSRKYLLVTDGEIVVSGIEHIERKPGAKAKVIQIGRGRYVVTANLIDWNQEPGALDSDGKPTETAMPDVIVQIEKAASPEGEYRVDIDPYRKEDALRQ